MKEFIKDLEDRKEKGKLMGGQAMIDRQHSLGRYTARERIDRFVDHGTFMEMGVLNRSEFPEMEGKSACDGLVAGLGHVDGRPSVILAADKTVLAAAEGMVFMRKAYLTFLKIKEFYSGSGLILNIIHLTTTYLLSFWLLTY